MENLNQIIQNSIKYNHEPRPIGIDGRIRIHYFLDFLTAVHDSESLDILSEHMAQLIIKNVNLEDYSAVVSPKTGNCLLAVATARRLKMKCGFVRSSVIFGSRIEGNIATNQKLLLLDDITADGELLLECVNSARSDGYLIDQAFSLVDRTEGDASKHLTDVRVKLCFAMALGDRDLERMKKK